MEASPMESTLYLPSWVTKHRLLPWHYMGQEPSPLIAQISFLKYSIIAGFHKPLAFLGGWAAGIKHLNSSSYRDSSVAKSTDRSSRWRGFNSQHPHGGWQPLLSPVPGHQMPTSGLYGQHAHRWWIYMHTNSHIYKIKNFNFCIVKFI